MAIIKKSAMKEMSVPQLQSKITELENEVHAELVAKTTAGKPSNPGRVRALKKRVARIKTLLTRKGIVELAKPLVVKTVRVKRGRKARLPTKNTSKAVAAGSTKPNNKA